MYSKIPWTCKNPVYVLTLSSRLETRDQVFMAGLNLHGSVEAKPQISCSAKRAKIFKIRCYLLSLFFFPAFATYTLSFCQPLLCTKHATVLSSPNRQSSEESKQRAMKGLQHQQRAYFLSSSSSSASLGHLTHDITTCLCHPVSYSPHSHVATMKWKRTSLPPLQLHTKSLCNRGVHTGFTAWREHGKPSSLW